MVAPDIAKIDLRMPLDLLDHTGLCRLSYIGLIKQISGDQDHTHVLLCCIRHHTLKSIQQFIPSHAGGFPIQIAFHLGIQMQICTMNYFHIATSFINVSYHVD